MRFEKRRRGKFKTAGKFVERIKKIQEKAKVVLEKAQKKIKKYIDRKQREEEEYKVENLVLLSTKDLKWQMVEKRLEKLIEQFIGSYRVKGIISTNTIKLKLPSSIKIYPVVNMSRVQLYRPQVEGQRKTPSKLVVIKGEEEFKIKKILNKRVIKEREKFLV